MWDKKAHMKQYYKDNKSRIDSYNKQWRLDNEEKVKIYRKIHDGTEKKRQKDRRYYSENKGKKSEYGKKYYKNIRSKTKTVGIIRQNKIELLNIMGGKCVCCGVSDWWNLNIDHVKPIKGDRISTSVLTKKLINSPELRKDFQILCYGCNNSKKRNEKCGLDHTKLY